MYRFIVEWFGIYSVDSMLNWKEKIEVYGIVKFQPRFIRLSEILGSDTFANLKNMNQLIHDAIRPPTKHHINKLKIFI
jgi:hypothetical protein